MGPCRAVACCWISQASPQYGRHGGLRLPSPRPSLLVISNHILRTRLLGWLGTPGCDRGDRDCSCLVRCTPPRSRTLFRDVWLRWLRIATPQPMAASKPRGPGRSCGVRHAEAGTGGVGSTSNVLMPCGEGSARHPGLDPVAVLMVRRGHCLPNSGRDR